MSNIVDRFMNEGKTREEILHYLIEIQKLTKKEAYDFLDFISAVSPADRKMLIKSLEHDYRGNETGRGFNRKALL